MLLRRLNAKVLFLAILARSLMLEGTCKRKRDKEKKELSKEKRAKIKNAFFNIPDELMIHLLSFLDVTSILKVGLANKELHRLTNDEYLWKCLFTRNYPYHPLSSDVSYRQRYAKIELDKQFPRLLDVIKSCDIEKIKLEFIRLKDNLSLDKLKEVFAQSAISLNSTELLKWMLEQEQERICASSDTYCTIFDIYALLNNVEALTLLYQNNPTLIQEQQITRFQCAAMNHAFDSIKWIVENLTISRQALSQTAVNLSDSTHLYIFIGGNPIPANGITKPTCDIDALKDYIQEQQVDIALKMDK
jgi:hypothetical protein